jgi:hypothetical protein
MKRLVKILFTLAACLAPAGAALAQDAAIKLNSSGGASSFTVTDVGGDGVFHTDSGGNTYAVGFSSANRFYGDGSALTNVSTQTIKVCDTYGGGKVFWVDAKGRNALVAAAADQSNAVIWGPLNTVTGAYGDAVYAGIGNTVKTSTVQGAGFYAARVCQNFSTSTLSGEYYDDWYLPSKNELQIMYERRSDIGGFALASYWSSTEYNTNGGWKMDFSSGEMIGYVKSSNFRVRCIRNWQAVGEPPRHADTLNGGAYAASPQTFTGINTFGAVTVTTLTVTAEARIARATTTAADTGLALTTSDFGRTITVNSAAARTVNLPAATAADIGANITVIKLGSGKVTIDAPAGVYIADSGAGGTIYNNAAVPAYAAITLRLVAVDRWVPVSGHGAWITTN